MKHNNEKKVHNLLQRVSLQIDDRYPGLKPLLQSNGFSVQAQTAYPIRTSIDQRGEQSINRDAKTLGNF